MTDTATPTETKPPALDWNTLLTDQTVTEVDTLTPPKSPDSIDAKIRELVDGLAKSGKRAKVNLPNGVAVKVFSREVRDYCYLVRPRLTATIKNVSDTEVRVQVKAYVDPKAAAPAAS